MNRKDVEQICWMSFLTKTNINLIHLMSVHRNISTCGGHLLNDRITSYLLLVLTHTRTHIHIHINTTNFATYSN